MSGDSFKVFDAYEVRDRLISATSSFLRDSRIAVSDNTSNPPPIPNCGGLWAGFADAGQVYATVTFDASGSIVVDPDTTPGDLDYAWSVGDGTITVGSVSTAQITVTFPVGFRHVTLVVSDGVTGKSATRRVPVWVHDRAMTAYPPLSVQLATLQNDSYMWSCPGFELPHGDEAHLDSVPDNALIVLWEQEVYGNVQASYGSAIANRSHIKFVGYITLDSIHIDAEDSTCTFEAVSPLAMLEQTPALPQLMIRASSPTKWTEIKGLSLNRMLHFVNYWHSSVMTYFDFYWVLTTTDLPYARIGIDSIDSMAGLLRDIANSINVDVTCDALGGIRLIEHPDYLSLADRNDVTVAYDLTEDDVLEVDITQPHRGQRAAKFVRGEGIVSATTVAAPKGVFSNAPGNAPDYRATVSDSFNKKIVANQTALNTLTGLHFARINGLYNGEQVPVGARLTLPDGYHVFEPGYREYVTFILPEGSNLRGRGYTDDTRWTIESVDITYDVEAGAKDIGVTLNHETFGVAGVTYVPPPESTAGLPTFPALDLTFPDLGFDFGVVTGGGLVPGTTRIALFLSDNNLALTTNFENPSSAGGPSWVIVDLDALAGWGGGTLVQFEFDAYSPPGSVNGWICTTTHVQRITGIGLTPVLGTAHAFSATSGLRSMRFERGTQNWGIVASYYIGAGTYVDYTTDGTNWTEVVADANFDTEGAFGWVPGVWLNPHVAGEAYTSGFDSTATGAGLTASLKRTTDFGATWADLTSPAADPGRVLPYCIIVPYADAGGDMVYYGHGTDPPPFDPRIYRGASTDISPQSGGLTFGPLQPSRSMSICDNDRNTLMVCAVDEYTGGATTFAVFLTNNAEAAVPTWAAVVAPSATAVYLQVYAVAANAFYLIGVNGAVGFSDGVTVDSRIGDLVTTAQVIGLAGW